VCTHKRAAERVPAAVEVRVAGLARAPERVGRAVGRQAAAVRGTEVLAVQG